MKKRILKKCILFAALITAVLTAPAVSADTTPISTTAFKSEGGTLFFTGTIRQVTCDLVPTLNLGGSRVPSINFPDMSPNSIGKDVYFYLSVVTSGKDGTFCNYAAANGLTISWSSSTGENIASGAIHSIPGGPRDAVMNLSALAANESGLAQPESRSVANNTMKYIYTPLATNDFRGVKYSAHLQSGRDAGQFSATLTYTVEYK